ncbi:hypothetical protein [Luteitalea sp.]
MTVKAKVIAAALLVLIVVSAVPVRGVLEAEMGSTLIWNGEKAWVFIPRQRLGWSGPRIGFVWEVVRTMLNASFGYERIHAWETVITITKEGVTEHTLAAPFQMIGVLDGAIVGGSGNVGLARWEGSKLVPLPEEVKGRYLQDRRSAVGLAGPDWFAQVNLMHGSKGDHDYVLPLDGATATLTASRNAVGSKRLTIRANGNERVIWSLDGESRFVSASEFERLSQRP